MPVVWRGVLVAHMWVLAAALILPIVMISKVDVVALRLSLHTAPMIVLDLLVRQNVRFIGVLRL
ncbi:hypothetical protein B5V03_34750 [Bradyrhizobium betae]|uniref:Uncharacterized protein n=1 Tax=Bradyrhizobium betae TaxID=244734 RepID=A0A4Q1UM78_9BRAD|nr:hypothetical protein B5V03_34750 [Bradyrhizobium betae]